ncbi:MAG: nickel pincer cofactor biosynthesis protein LarC, partial [Planctomycetaceae bacterium]|nr:nickel pincer cofactor biosynthesis protein LarC [Planctomycetaceae bacterium]
MKIAYFDCVSGISGDMTLGALVDAGVPVALMDRAVQSLGVPGLQIEAETVQRHAMRALRVHVRCPHEHVHRHLSDILAMIDTAKDAGALTPNAAELAGNIFRKLAEAEAKVHGTDMESVHFHEVGAADSIADIVGAAVGLDYLSPDAIYASAVPTGTGTIKIAHGTCSVPAPATAELLKGVPIAASDVPLELTTPTGAAILATTVKAFLPMPAMTITSIGCGAGGRDLPGQANLLRLIVGETDDVPEHAHAHEHHHEHAHHHEHEHPHDGEHGHDHAHDHSHVHVHDHTHGHEHSHDHPHEHDHDEIQVLETNLDDMTGEMIGYCIEKLWEAGPLDVDTTAIQMKKQRPGVKLTVLCRAGQVGQMEAILFEHTTTLGVRRMTMKRTVLRREKASVETRWGTIDGKVAILPDGSKRFAPEFDS